MRNASSFDFFIKNVYRPKENVEHIYQMTSLALILYCDRRVSQDLVQSKHFETPLITDIKYILEKVQRIDPQFLRLAF